MAEASLFPSASECGRPSAVTSVQLRVIKPVNGALAALQDGSLCPRQSVSGFEEEKREPRVSLSNINNANIQFFINFVQKKTNRI